MRNFVNQLENVATRRGLYCVWSMVNETRGARLVARWIDPQAETREPQMDTARFEGHTEQLWLGEDLEVACRW